MRGDLTIASSNPDPFQEYPEFDVDNWTQINKSIPAERITGFIEACLHDKYFEKLMMNQYATLIDSAARNILCRTDQLLQSLGQLQTLITGKSDQDTQDHDWAEYKRKQRSQAAREFWEKYRHRKQLLQRVGETTSKTGGAHTDSGSTEFLSGLLEPFSSKGNSKRAFDGRLQDIIKLGLSHLMPWHQIITNDLSNGKLSIDDLTVVIGNLKKDKAFKFQTLIRMAHEGKVELGQDQSFDPININPVDLDGTGMKLTTRGGEVLTCDWKQLSETQRTKVIRDLKNGKIVLT